MGNLSLQPVNQLILLNLQVGNPELKFIRVLAVFFVVPPPVENYLILKLRDLVLETLVLLAELLTVFLRVVLCAT